MRGRALSLETPSLPFTGMADAQRLSSEMAAVRAGTTAQTDRGRIYAFLLEFFGVVGATDKEIQQHLLMDGNTQRPRRIELVKAGLVVDSGTKRNGCTVWRAK